VNHRTSFFHHSPIPDTSLKQQSTLAWLAICALILFASAFIFGGAGSIMRPVFPLACLIVGIFLYIKAPVLYIGFTWWLWFVIAIIRRYIDYRYGWDQQGLILVAPFLVTMITFATLFRSLPKSYRMGGLPFILAFVAVFYGFLIGLVNFQPIVVFRTMLDWIAPILFGFHLFVNWRNYPNYRQNFQTVFIWSTIITGTYGLVQYIVAPEWDRFWLVQTALTTAGSPIPYGIRVWSTMHSPGPFATVIMAGLLLLFNSKHPLGVPAIVVGYTSFLLSLVRSAWGGWAVAVLALLTTFKPKLQMRLIITLMLMVLCVTPLTIIKPFSDIINARLQTVTNIQKDDSYQARSQIYDRNLNIALSSPLGKGIGGTWIVNEKNGRLEPVIFDSGILDAFFALGWFGAIPYLGGISLILYDLYQGSQSRNDSFANAARAISLGMFSQLILGSSMLGLSGMILWGFMGMGMAAKKYHQYELTNGIR